MSSFNLWNIEWYRKNETENLDSKLEGAICNSTYNILCKSNNNFLFLFLRRTIKNIYVIIFMNAIKYEY